ncbi:MAG: ABC transporter ATP-binding protein [Thermoleophilia bacterium]
MTGPAAHGDAPAARLVARDLRVGYGEREVLHGLGCEIPAGEITAIVGANASGKSTLLRAMARLLRARTGAVLLDGEAISGIAPRALARRLGFLPQSPTPPEGLTVEDLVSRGRFPHQRIGRRASAEDRAKVAWALAATGTADLAQRSIDQLSGGQRQRVWIAMALAQDTDVLLLDEPTTYLDLAHQLEVLDLLADLNRIDGRTFVMVLHDINHACRYAHHLIAVRDGAVHAAGPPAEIVTEDLIAAVLGLRARVMPDPVTGTPMCVPVGRIAEIPAK